MAKLYSDSTEKVEHMNPRKETVSFLLNYSKSLEINRIRDLEFENILN